MFVHMNGFTSQQSQIASRKSLIYSLKILKILPFQISEEVINATKTTRGAEGTTDYPQVNGYCDSK